MHKKDGRITGIHKRTCVHTYRHVEIHTYTRAHTYIHIHPYMYIHTYTEQGESRHDDAHDDGAGLGAPEFAVCGRRKRILPRRRQRGLRSRESRRAYSWKYDVYMPREAQVACEMRRRTSAGVADERQRDAARAVDDEDHGLVDAARAVRAHVGVVVAETGNHFPGARTPAPEHVLKLEEYARLEVVMPDCVRVLVCACVRACVYVSSCVRVDVSARDLRIQLLHVQCIMRFLYKCNNCVFIFTEYVHLCTCIRLHIQVQNHAISCIACHRFDGWRVLECMSAVFESCVLAPQCSA